MGETSLRYSTDEEESCYHIAWINHCTLLSINHTSNRRSIQLFSIIAFCFNHRSSINNSTVFKSLLIVSIIVNQSRIPVAFSVDQKLQVSENVDYQSGCIIDEVASATTLICKSSIDCQPKI